MNALGGKVAVITGAASGIGLAVAERCAAEGMRLVLADVEAAPLEAAKAMLSAAGAEVVAQVTDVSRQSDVDALRDLTVRTYGTAHLVVNNAGVSTSGRVWEFPPEVWAWILGVNLWGVIHGVSAFVPLLCEQGEGHVVNTSSMQGLAPTVGGGPYAVSKHAVVALSEVLLADLRAAGIGVGVSVLCPGPVRTRIYDSERNMPEDARQPEQRSSARVKAFLDAKGIEPAVVADQVLDAVRRDRFYVLTDRSRVTDVLDRARAVTEGETP